MAEKICELDGQIAAMVKADAGLNRTMEILTSIKGVGKVTAIAMIIATNGFKKFASAKKLACYCGVAPFQNQSGSSIKGRAKVSKLANMQIKPLLFLCACSTVRKGGIMHEFYEKKKKVKVS